MLGLGAFFAIGSLGQGLSEAIYAFAVGLLQMFFMIFVVIWPAIVFIIPLYILAKRDYKYIILGGVYGLAMVLVVYLFNLPALALQIYNDTFRAAFLDIPILGTIMEYLLAFAYWCYGILLSALDGTLLNKIRNSWHKAHQAAKKKLGGKGR